MKINKELEQELYTSMTKLGLTYDEAVELHYFDKEETTNDDVSAIESKIKTEKEAVVKVSPIGKVKLMKAKRKIDFQRTDIINKVFGFLKTMEEVKASAQMTSSKVSFETEDGTFYSVTVTKHKSKPDGFSKNLIEDTVEDSQE